MFISMKRRAFVDARGSLLVGAVVAIFGAQSASAAVFTATSNADLSLCTNVAATCATINTAPPHACDGPCTLRAALEKANDVPGFDSIAFNITGSPTLVPASPLPTIDERVVIDGASQPGYTPGHPVVTISGGNAGSTSGLLIGTNPNSGGTVIVGLVINGFALSGILVRGPGGNVIAGNFIGMDADGSTMRPNHLDGIRILDSPNNTIGGLTAGAGNLVSGNTGAGVAILNAASTGNTLQGNFIGTDVTGTAARRNGTGVLVSAVVGQTGYASGNTIGGIVPEARNVISGNNLTTLGFGVGIELFHSSSNVIRGNYIGTTADGLDPLNNYDAGIYLEEASDNIIGGT